MLSSIIITIILASSSNGFNAGVYLQIICAIILLALVIYFGVKYNNAKNDIDKRLDNNCIHNNSISFN